MYKYIIFFSLGFLSFGCTTNLNDLRDSDIENNTKIRDISSKRTLTISEGETLYSDSLRCISKNFLNPSTKLDITVSKIFDKTGKLYPVSPSNISNSSTALSDILINALSKMPDSFNIIDAPLGDFRDSRVNLLDEKNPLIKSFGKLDVGILGAVPIGVIYPSTTYLSGALVLYDEGTEISKDNSGVNLGFDPLSLSRNINTITVGVNLRMVNSGTGRIVDNGSIILTNRLRTIRKSTNLFKIISDDARIFDYDTSVSDPKHYALMEIIEKGLYTLFSRQIGNTDVCLPENLLN